jgi:hypothetical protein
MGMGVTYDLLLRGLSAVSADSTATGRKSNSSFANATTNGVDEYCAGSLERFLAFARNFARNALFMPTSSISRPTVAPPPADPIANFLGSKLKLPSHPETIDSVA